MLNLNNIEKEIEEVFKHSDTSDPMDRKKDPGHSQLVRDWVLKLRPGADLALQIAALAHDIDRAIEARRAKREDFKEYDDYKKRHGEESAKIIGEILEKQGAEQGFIDRVRSLIKQHEFGGSEEVDILKEADSLTFFSYDIYFYIKYRGLKKTKRKIQFMYTRISDRAKELVKNIEFKEREVAELVQEVISKF